MKLCTKPQMKAITIVLSIAFACLSLLLYFGGYLPVVGNIIANYQINKYAVEQRDIQYKLDTRYDWYTSSYKNSNDLSFDIVYDIRTNKITDHLLLHRTNKQANYDYLKAVAGLASNNLTFPKSIFTWASVDANNYEKITNSLYFMVVYNSDDITEAESMKMPARITSQLIGAMGQGYNITWVQMIYGDKNGMFEISDKGNSKAVSEQSMVKNTKKMPESRLPEDYLEWLNR